MEFKTWPLFFALHPAGGYSSASPAVQKGQRWQGQVALVAVGCSGRTARSPTNGISNNQSTSTGWWFGTWMDFDSDSPYIGNVIIPTDELIFSDGLKPPIRFNFKNGTKKSIIVQRAHCASENARLLFPAKAAFPTTYVIFLLVPVETDSRPWPQHKLKHQIIANHWWFISQHTIFPLVYGTGRYNYDFNIL